MNNIKALKAGIWYTMANFLIRGIGLITTPIFTRLMSARDFGYFNSYTSIQSILVIIITLNLEASFISAKHKFEKDFDRYAFSVLILSVLSTFVWFILFLMFGDYVSSMLGIDKVYLLSMFFYLLSTPCINLFLSKAQLFYQYRASVVIAILTSLGCALLSIILVYLMNDGLCARIIGLVVPNFLIGVILFVVLFHEGKRVDILYWKYALPICIPYIPHLLSMTMLNAMDKIMITKWCGPEENALYSLAYTCGAIVTVLLSSMNSAFAPWLGDQIHLGNVDEIRRVSKYYVLIFTYIVFLIMLMAPDIIWILGGSSYLEAKHVLAPIAVGCLCQFLYTLFVNVEQYMGDTKMMSIASVLAAIVNLTLNYICIPKYGYLAAAYTTLVGYLVLLLLHMLIVKKMKMSHVYDYKFIIEVIAISLLAMHIITILYSYNLFRYALLTIMILFGGYIVVRNRKTLTRIIAKWRDEND